MKENIYKFILTLVLINKSLFSFENGDFDGDDSVWKLWIVDNPIQIDLNHTNQLPSGGDNQSLKILAYNWGNGGIYQQINLDSENLYKLSGLFKGINCSENWFEISILQHEPLQGVDIGLDNIIVSQNYWDCGASSPWNWDLAFKDACGTNNLLPGSGSGLFSVAETGDYYLLIKSGGASSEILLDNLTIDIIDANPPNFDWELKWSDEFESPAIDITKWSYDIGNGDWGWGNGEEQYYTNNSNNSYIDNGVLIIQSNLQNYGGENYTSARMVTKNKGDWKYGKIEVRAKLPSGTGTWPSIWMLPTDWVYGGWPYSGEIDILEHVGFDQDVVHFTAHTEVYNWLNGIPPPGFSGNGFPVSQSTSSFHTYKIEWDENSIKWYVDDAHKFTFNNNQSNSPSDWPFNQRFHLILNIAIGGSWGGQQGIDNSIFPVRLEVDYVRIYQKTIQLSNQKVQIPVYHNTVTNYPNPFNPSTNIKYALANDGDVRITIYDINGKEIKSLIDSFQFKGIHHIRWNAKDNLNRSVSAGLYYYTIVSGIFRDTRKMVLLK